MIARFVILGFLLLVNIPRSILANYSINNSNYQFQFFILFAFFLLSLLKRKIYSKRVFLLIYIYIVLFCISTVFTGFISFRIQYLLSILTFVVLVFSSLRSDSWLSQSEEFIIFAGVILLAPSGLFLAYLGGSYGANELTMNAVRLAGPFGGSTIIGMVACIFAVYVMGVRVNSALRVLSFLYFMGIIFLSQSRGALVVLVLVVLWNNRKSVLKLKYLIPSFGFSALVYVILYNSSFSRLISFGLGSDNERLDKIYRAIEFQNKYNISLGQGKIWFYNADDQDLMIREIFDPHNLYLGLWFEIGVIGVVCVLFFFFWHVRQLDKVSKSVFLTVFVYGFISSDLLKNPIIILVLFMLSIRKQKHLSML